MDKAQSNEGLRKLAELFSGYRAEWLESEIFDLFTEPSYFPQLTTSHPCFLVGGRGTGKTTALRCLSYQGQEVLRRYDNTADVSEWPYVGIYYRVNTNRVRAFAGPELSEARWIKLFGHYINLEFSELVLQFLEWYGVRHPEAPRLATEALGDIGAALHLPEVSDQTHLIRELELSRLRFEAAINNVADAQQPQLSLQGAAIDQLLRAVKQLPQFASTSFFFLVDEYENLDPAQQRVLNTLIKHCGALYSFKVSVRELGFTQRSTLNEHEQLAHPADYKLINITEELEHRFAEFAAKVCDRRLKNALDLAATAPNLQALLPELSAEDEALLLGVREVIAPILEGELRASDLNPAVRSWCEAIHPLELFTLACRARAEGISPAAKVRDAMQDLVKWREQYDNYKHAYLFVIRRRKRGVRKYFAGWRVFCLLAASNIRYLLELVDQALTLHLDSGGDPLTPVKPEVQTRAAQATGQKNLRELEGLALNGAKLTRLVLGLGRVFQVMAEDPIGHTPEVNQFHLSAEVVDTDLHERVSTLFRDGIMHLALLRYPGSKLQEHSDIRQFDYAIHPIFAPFFGFSHRRKRKIEISEKDVWTLVENPTEAVGSLLRGQHRSVEEDLPEQMRLFADFYAIPRQ